MRTGSLVPGSHLIDMQGDIQQRSRCADNHGPRSWNMVYCRCAQRAATYLKTVRPVDGPRIQARLRAVNEFTAGHSRVAVFISYRAHSSLLATWRPTMPGTRTA
jgi:hypothetical protein